MRGASGTAGRYSRRRGICPLAHRSAMSKPNDTTPPLEHHGRLRRSQKTAMEQIPFALTKCDRDLFRVTITARTILRALRIRVRLSANAGKSSYRAHMKSLNPTCRARSAPRQQANQGSQIACRRCLETTYFRYFSTIFSAVALSIRAYYASHIPQLQCRQHPRVLRWPFFAQARIYRIETHTRDEIEIYAAINLPDFGTEADAIAFSNEWPVHRIEENAFEVAETQTEHA